MLVAGSAWRGTESRNKKRGGRKMTLAQLRYTIAIAKAGSMNEAAKSLYISQPSLSTAGAFIEENRGQYHWTR